jgi:hypothetical protein
MLKRGKNSEDEPAVPSPEVDENLITRLQRRNGEDHTGPAGS